MKKAIRISFIMLFILVALTSYSQQDYHNISERETGFMHLNSNVFVSGDILGYTAYLTNKSGFASARPGTVFYFDLVNPQNESILYWRTNASEGISTGNLQIPDTLQTGVYLLRFYTQRMLNQSIGSISYKPIVIVNIRDENPETLILPMELDDLLAASDSGKVHTLIKPEISAQILVQGDSLSFAIEIPASVSMQSAAFSISVAKLSFPRREFFITDTSQDINTHSESLTLPDISMREVQSPHPCRHCINEAGFYVFSGRVFNPQSDVPYDNHVVFISYSDSVALLKYTITDVDGNFCFFLDSSYDNKNLVLQLDGLGVEKMVKWDITPKKLSAPKGVTSVVPITPHYTKQLEDMRKLSMVNRIINPYIRSDIFDGNTSRRNFFSTPSYTIYPSEFEHLNDFSEIARNLLPRVRFRKSGDEFKIGIADGDNQIVNYDKILFLLNGHPFQNMEFISALSSADIRSIDVVYNPFMYGDLKYNGLVSIYTAVGITLNAEVLASPICIVSNPVLKEQYVAADKGYNTKPGISPSILWIPSATISRGEIINITTPGLYFKGDYVISMAGFGDNGEPIQQMIRFSVNDPLY